MVVQETGRVPQIYKNGELIGGYTDLYDLYRDAIEYNEKTAGHHDGQATTNADHYDGQATTNVVSDPECAACDG